MSASSQPLARRGSGNHLRERDTNSVDASLHQPQAGKQTAHINSVQTDQSTFPSGLQGYTHQGRGSPHGSESPLERSISAQSLTGRRGKDQTAESRAQCAIHWDALNSFNVEVGKLLQVYRRLKDTGGKGPVGLKAFWRQMDLVKDQFETTRSLVAPHRQKGRGGRYHMLKGYVLNLPFDWFRHTFHRELDFILDPESGISEEMAEWMDELGRFYIGAIRSRPGERRRGEVTKAQIEEWNAEQGWTKTPIWVVRYAPPL